MELVFLSGFWPQVGGQNFIFMLQHASKRPLVRLRKPFLQGSAKGLKMERCLDAFLIDFAVVWDLPDVALDPLFTVFCCCWTFSDKLRPEGQVSSILDLF